MAGHSKWANIKHRKAAQDAKRSKVFSKLAKEITVAAKQGGTDPEMNPRLRLAVQTAKKNSVPKDVIDRALAKAAGNDSADYQELTYEGYAPNGVAVIVEAATDNINRTVANIRAIFNKGGGSMGTSGSVSFLFERKGSFVLNLPAGKDEEEFTLELLDYGAEDVEVEDGVFQVTTAFEDFGAFNRALEEAGIEAEEAEVRQIPATEVPLDIESAQKVLRVVDNLEDDDDVQKVWHNLEMTDELAAALA